MLRHLSSNTDVEWQVSDEESCDDATWQALLELTAAEDTTASPEQTPHVRLQARVYELVLIAVCFAGAIGFVGWWRIDQRFVALEREVLALRGELASFLQSEAEGSTGDAEAQSNTSRQLIETELLRFEAEDQYATIVRSIAAPVDQEYGRLRSDFGLALRSQEGKPRVIIGPAQELVLALANPTAVVIPATAIKVSGHEVGEEEALRRVLLTTLAQRTLAEALADRDIKWQWSAMTRSLGYYLVREHSSMPEWRTLTYYIVRRHKGQSRSIDGVFLQADRPDGLHDYWAESELLAEEIADTLIEFVLVEYGYSHLPRLLDGFEQYDSWTTLAPAVFGLEADEFEEAWHEFLRREYPG